ncbi:proton-coupled folate transporter-like [Halyomorpha halys]|uniref:proton-coupled folate transporter-like n=1 Tax=Halyomorpha halys TaxID=286706 RepID=UPI0034D1D88F
MSFLSKIRYILRNITVEPMISLYIVGTVIVTLAAQNLSLEKACKVNLQFGEICGYIEHKVLANFSVEENAVQHLVATVSIWKSLLHSSVPALLIFLFGSWSDRNSKRKPCMLVPIAGDFLAAIGLIVCSYLDFLSVQTTSIVEVIFPAITGDSVTVLMAVFSYMGDITTMKTRTLRIGIVNVCISVSNKIGSAVSGVLFKKLGFYGVFSLSACIVATSFLYGYFMVPEVPSPEDNSRSRKQGSGITAFMKDFFDLQHIKVTFCTAFKVGPNNRRKRVILLIVVALLLYGPHCGKYYTYFLLCIEPTFLKN